MRRTVGSSSSGIEVDDNVRLPLKEYEDADEEEDVLSARTSAAVRPSRTRQPLKQGCCRALPWALLAVLALLVVLEMPGGLGVFFCACRKGDSITGNVTLVGHRGSEWPLPGNTLRALRLGARIVHFVHLDAAISADGIPFAIAGRLEHTTNGTGPPCAQSATYIRSLVVSPPTHDAQAQLHPGQLCMETPIGGGRPKPCQYRVPTLESIIVDLPAHTRFMIQIDACDRASRPPDCLKCSHLVSALTTMCSKNFVTQDRLFFVAQRGESKEEFMRAFPDATFLMVAGHEYAHYSRSRFVETVKEGKWDGVAMSIALAGWRPDLGYAVASVTAMRTTKKLVRFVMTARSDWDSKLAFCAGVKRLVVADPRRIAKMFGYKRKTKR